MSAKIVITKIAPSGDLAVQLEPPMQRLGQAVGARMQRLVPKRSWALHDTIGTSTTRSGSKVETTVGAGSSKVRYPLYVERGTSRMRAQPFMRPALAQTTGSDLAYRGTGIVAHGIITPTTHRQRMRDGQ